MNRMAQAMLKAALSVAVAGLAAQAETLYDKDGVQFEGTIRLVTSGAGRCNVLEEKYSEQEYEKLKANQDQPLDLWRVDFLIRNGSGRVIDYLNASSWVNAEYPPCTNWSGPDRAPLESSVWVVWGDHLVPMQKPSGMRAGQEERHAVYLMVFHEHRPTFGEWNIDYDFAKEAASGKEPAAGASRMPVSGGAMSTAPAGSESQENLFWQSIMNSTTAADFEAYLRQFPNGIFRVLAQNRLAALRGPASDPPVTAGKPATAAASRVESRAPQPPRQAEQGRTSGISAGQTCAGKPKGAACWKELADQPGCFVWNDSSGWNDSLVTDETVTWTEECAGGLAQGTGTLTRVWGRSKKHKREETGHLQDGEKHGHWVERSAGTVQEGPYVDGKMHGDWVVRSAKGTVQEGPFVDSKMHGRWVFRLADGGVYEGPYVDGKKHGRWVLRLADGQVEEGPYVDGKRHGDWVLRFADGQVEEGPFVDGKRHGRWVLRLASGGVQEGPFVDGKRHGRWVKRFADGGVQEGPYVDGKLHGRWVTRFADGGTVEGPYVDGKRHGRWVQRFAGGGGDEGSYVDGKRHGRWVTRWSSGGVDEGSYVDGEKHGRWVSSYADGDVEIETYVNGEKQ